MSEWANMNEKAEKGSQGDVANKTVAAGKASVAFADIPAAANSRFGAHWHIFVPTLVIAILYLGGWIGLFFMHGSHSGLSRLFIIVLAVGVPLLLAHAFIRYQTIFLEIYDDHFLVHTGWPRAEAITLPFQVVRGVSVRRGLSGRIFGGGSLFIELISSDLVVLADVRSPELAKQQMEAAIRNEV